MIVGADVKVDENKLGGVIPVLEDGFGILNVTPVGPVGDGATRAGLVRVDGKFAM